MADSNSRSKTPHSPHKSKVMRSQKISSAVTSPTSASFHHNDSEADEARDRAPPPLPRSHTPGHLASKSQDRRRKPSDVAIRPRSQSSAAVTSPPAGSAQPPFSIPTTKTPGPDAGLAPSRTPIPTPTPTASASASAPAPPPTSATTAQPSAPVASNGGHNDDVAASSSSLAQSQHHLRERAYSSAGSSSGAPGRNSQVRPTALRSTSAIAARPGSSMASVARGSATSAGTARQHHPHHVSAIHRQPHVPFPPLCDPRTAPDVPPAPSSGMYWSRAPTCGSPHTSLRAHTATMVFSNVYVFGGCDARACFNELYVLDADSFYWSRPHVVGDIPVPLRAMTCTAVGKKLVVFGGGDGPAYYNDIYVLDTVNFRWSRPRLVGDARPSKRRAHTACLYKNGIYVFGGGDGVRALNDVWRLDVTDTAKMSWRLISSALESEDMGTSQATLRPKARGYHTANMVGGKLIIFGGSDGGECFNDVWVYDVDTHIWTAVGIPVTHRRLSHTATLVGSYLFVIGGHDGNEYSNDVLLLNLVTMQWDKRRVYGLPPSGRGYHTTVIYDSRLLMIGGFDGSEVFADVWTLELAVHAYYSQISHFRIEV